MYPDNLKFTENLTNNNYKWGLLGNFDVYIGLKDNIEYLVYINKQNHNLEIMRINDKTIISSLKGHNNDMVIHTFIIRYYQNNNKEEYIISGDSELLIIWDIQDNYNEKYILKLQNNEYYCYDALLLFNIFNQNYILISNTIDKYSSLYLLNENTPFIKNIDGTEKNDTRFMIPWKNNNKEYVIDCCINKISINNIFEDDCYANFIIPGSHLCGYIYDENDENYLCVNDYSNSIIRIWNLSTKIFFKQIQYYAKKGAGITPWNNEFAIIACEDCLVIMNIYEGKMVKKITTKDKHYFKEVKKIKISNLGECLISSDNGGNIILYSLQLNK